MPYDEDRELVERAIAGDRSAWGELTSRYETTMRFAVRHALGRFGARQDEELVEDLRSEVILRLFRNDAKRLRSYRGQCSLRQWLKVVTANYTIDHLRGRRKLLSLDEPKIDTELIDTRPTPEERLEANELRRSVSELMGRLPAEDRLFIELYYARGHDFERVATLMGTTLGAVYARKNRIRKKLERLVTEERLLG